MVGYDISASQELIAAIYDQFGDRPFDASTLRWETGLPLDFLLKSGRLSSKAIDRWLMWAWTERLLERDCPGRYRLERWLSIAFYKFARALEQDIIDQWLAACCESGKHYKAMSGQLYASYCHFAQGEIERSNKWFSEKLKIRGFKKAHARGGNEFSGLRLRDNG